MTHRIGAFHVSYMQCSTCNEGGWGLPSFLPGSGEWETELLLDQAQESPCLAPPQRWLSRGGNLGTLSCLTGILIEYFQLTPCGQRCSTLGHKSLDPRPVFTAWLGCCVLGWGGSQLLRLISQP